MLDKLSTVLLKIINTECEDGTYKVIDASTLLQKFPRKYHVELSQLNVMLETLKKRDYIDVKYSDNNVYCLCTLPKGKLQFENLKDDSKVIKKVYKMLSINLILTSVFAFLGAMVAILLFK